MRDLRDALSASLTTVTRAERDSSFRRATLTMRFNTALKTVAVAMILVLGFIAPARAQSVPTIYVDGPEDFSSAITAALSKKHVPVQVTLDGEHAEYILHASGVSNKTESGKSQIARCLFMDCIGAFGSSSVSVTLVKANSPAILWAYQVRKSVGGPLGTQSLSEAIAKHLRNDSFKKN